MYKSVIVLESLTTTSLCVQKQPPQVLDTQVVHGHVIPGMALFTRPASKKNEETESLAFTDNLKVFLKMVNVSSQTEANLCKFTIELCVLISS